MPRLNTSVLIRLGHGKGPSFQASSASLDGFDSAAAASDGCSTSFSSIGWGAQRPHVGLLAQARRCYAHRYNFLQPVDTNHINDLLDSATRLEHAAIPVLQYSAWFDPEQVTRTIQRVPRMLRYQRRKGFKAASSLEPQTTARLLLDRLGGRLAQVASDCSDQQLARALWAYGVGRHDQPDVVRVACEQLPRRLGSMSMPHLATAAWGLAAATAEAPEPAKEHVRQVLQNIARHIVAARPQVLTAPATHGSATTTTTTTGAVAPFSLSSLSSSSSSSPSRPPLIQPAAEVVAAASGRAGVLPGLEQPWMDHRSALQLAWAFATAGVRDPQAFDVIGDAAAARITSQMQAHDWATGPLSPRATYLYRTIRGWQAWPRPRPPRVGTAGRPSRYLRHERPRVVLRDFTLDTLAPLLASFRRAGHRHEGLLQASARHAVASAGPRLRVSLPDLARLVGAYEALGFRNPAALTALLTCTQLADLPVPALAHLTVTAAEWGVRRKALYGRLVRQLAARAWVPGEGDAEGGGALAAAKGVALVPGGDVAAPEQQSNDGEEGEARLAPAARESWERRARASWRTAPSRLEREDAAWRRALRDRSDRVAAADVARLLLALTKIGYNDPNTPFAGPLFAAVLPHLPHLSRDDVAGLALAAVHFRPQLDRHVSSSAAALDDVLRDATSVVLYGTTEGMPPVGSQDLGRRLREMAGFGAGSSGSSAGGYTLETEDQAAAMRRDLGLSAGGALRLALALTARPEAVSERDMRAALALVDTRKTSRRQMGVLISRMRQLGRDGLLPGRLLAAAEEAGRLGEGAEQ